MFYFFLPDKSFANGSINSTEMEEISRKGSFTVTNNGSKQNNYIEFLGF